MNMTQKRDIRHIVVHCTATPQSASVAQILRSFKARGWKAPGYHYIVRPDGSAASTWPEDRVANGVKGHNADSLHVAYIGGTDANGHPVDNRTPQQREALRHIVTLLRAQYPKAMVCGHRDLSPDLDGNGRIEPWEYVKACPCFDAVKEYATV